MFVGFWEIEAQNLVLVVRIDRSDSMYTYVH